jgi:membrane dipeptidase
MTEASPRIVELLRTAPLIDGHNDLPFALRDRWVAGDPIPDPAGPCPELQTDLPRAEAGGLRGQFWSVYVESHLDEGTAVTRTLDQIDRVRRLVAANPDRLAHARTADEVEAIAASGRIASMIGVEGGHCIGSSLGALRTLAALGAGYLTLTHNDDTPWADSATGSHPHRGLTRFGEEVVRELNRCGVLVDCSHVSDDVMRQAIEVSEAPVVFSHSSARGRCDVTRNVPDDVLEVVGRTGGVVMIAFVPTFVAREGAAANRAAWAEADRVRAAHPDDPGALHEAMEAWYAAQGEVSATVGDVADHVDHVREVAGIDAVGIGSDFDGAASMPAGLEDVSRYPALFAELAERGYTDDELSAIAGRNVLRLMRDAERVAARLREERPPSTARIEDLDA